MLAIQTPPKGRTRSLEAAAAADVFLMESIRPHFQPIVASAGQHGVFAYEALLRAPNAPATCDVLFRRWESTGEVVSIDTMMARRVRRAVKRLDAPIAVSVNVSGLTIALEPDAYLAEIALLSEDTNFVIVEVTETFPIPDVAALARFADRCRELGVVLAFDDCSPHHEFCLPSVLAAIRPQIMKIDGNLFIRAFDSGDVAPLIKVIQAAKSVDAAVVVEHVASGDMCDFAEHLGVEFFQGHFFGSAMPASELRPKSLLAHA